MHYAYKQWLFQRVTAIILAVYFISVFYIIDGHVNYHQWLKIMQMPMMQASTLLALASMLWHGWVGFHGVLMDYLKLPSLRLIIGSIILFSYMWMFFWGIIIVWRIL